MKKNVMIVLFLIGTIASLSAQKMNFGIKAGYNYNNFGKGALKDNSNDLFHGGDNKAGYHIGMFIQAKVPMLGLYVRPEFVYTRLKSEYSWNNTDPAYNSMPFTGEFKLSKIDIPVLIGTNLLGPINVFIGPAFQFITDADFKAGDITSVKTKDFSLGLQMGVAVELGKLGVEVRWERGLTDNEANITHNNISDDIVIDSRPDQIIFGLFYKFGEKRN